MKTKVTTCIGFMLFLLVFVQPLIISGCTKPETTTENPLSPPPVREEEPVDTVAPWKQNEFILSTFFALPGSADAAVYRKILTLTKASGINLVELPFISPEALLVALTVAEETGVRTLAQNQQIYSGIGASVPPFNEAALANEAKFLKRFRMLEGYYVWDEPFEKDFAVVKAVQDLLQKHDPARLAFSTLFPSYGVYNWEEGEYNWETNSYARYVTNYITEVNPTVLSFNYYPYRDNKEGTSLIVNDLWKDFGYIRKKALEYNKPLWYYFQAVSIDPNETGVMNVERIRAQMYGALAYGVKGLSYYTSRLALLTADNEKTAMYDDLTALNSAVKNLGNLLLNKTSEYVYHTGVGAENQAAYFLDDIQASDLIGTAPDNLIIGVLRGTTDERYLVLTNKSHAEEVQGKLTFKKHVQVTSYDKVRQINELFSAATNEMPIVIAPGEALVFIVN